MRIRVLPLTPSTVGAVVTLPYALIIDRTSSITPEMGQAIKDQSGAAFVLVSNDDIELEDVPDNPEMVARISALVG